MAANLFSPSEYTAALIHHVRSRSPRVPLGNVLEMGTGSGVVLASLLELGAERALGVDIELAAVQATRALMAQAGFAPRASIVQGDMWQACGTECFDLVVSNPPQFAAERVEGDGHLPTWSAGGKDGRDLVDRFLLGLPTHLAAGGLAVMTHNVFLDLAKTRALLALSGLQATVAASVSVPLSAQKRASISPEVLARYGGHGLYTVGGYGFVDFEIVEISWRADAAPAR